MEKETSKKQKQDESKVEDEAKMKKHMEIVVDEEEIAFDAIPLATRPPNIIDWEIVTKGKKSYYVIIRVGGQSKRKSMGQQGYKEELRESYGTGRIYMLVEKKYPLTVPTMIDMFNKKLQVDEFNQIAFQLLKLIKD
ncbi:hypothetical protein Tco_0309177 [Tanacetum coccineum]